MRLIDVTNSYARIISQELLESSLHFIKVYSLGNSKVVQKQNSHEIQIVISNKVRPITPSEIDFVKEQLLGDNAAAAAVTQRKNVVEIVLQRN